jgi:hypothetical protein
VYALFSTFIISFGFVGLAKSFRNIIGLSITAAIVKLGIIILFGNPYVKQQPSFVLLSTVAGIFFSVRLVVFWLLTNYEDSFIVKVLSILLLTFL